MADLRGGSTVGGRPILGKEARDNYIGKIVGNKLKESLLYDDGSTLTVQGNKLVIAGGNDNAHSIKLERVGSTAHSWEIKNEGGVLYFMGNVGATTERMRIDASGNIHLGSQATSTSHAVRADRAISAGTGLSGGGDFTTNRTISIDSTVLTTGRSISNGGSGNTGVNQIERNSASPALYVDQNGSGDIAQFRTGGTSVKVSINNSGLLNAVGGLQWNGQSLDSRYLGIGAKASDSNLLDGLDSTSFIRSNASDTFTGNLVAGARQAGIYGTYDSNKIDHIWSMGTAYKVEANGANFGNLYGMAYKHSNNTTGGTMASGHQMVWVQNGTPYVALGNNLWASGAIFEYGTQLKDRYVGKSGDTMTGSLGIAGNLSIDGGGSRIYFDTARTNKSSIHWNANSTVDYGMVLNVDGAGILTLRNGSASILAGDLDIEGTAHFPSNKYASQGGGINMRNSDIINANNVFMADTSDGQGEGIQWMRTSTPSNDYDTNKWDSFRIKDGIIYLNSEPIGTSNQRVLWSGGLYMSSGHTISGLKDINTCANGWILVWSDYNAPSTLNDINWVCTFVYKGVVNAHSGNHYFSIPNAVTSSTVSHAVKTLTFTNTTISGDTNNNQTANNGEDVVIRYVIEF